MLNPEIDEAIRRIDAGEDAWNEDDEVLDLEAGGPLRVVVSFPLPPEAWEKLRGEAKKLGVGPNALARMWTLYHLSIVEGLPPPPSRAPRKAKSRA